MRSANLQSAETASAAILSGKALPSDVSSSFVHILTAPKPSFCLSPIVRYFGSAVFVIKQSTLPFSNALMCERLYLPTEIYPMTVLYFSELCSASIASLSIPSAFARTDISVENSAFSPISSTSEHSSAKTFPTAELFTLTGTHFALTISQAEYCAVLLLPRFILPPAITGISLRRSLPMPRTVPVKSCPSLNTSCVYNSSSILLCLWRWW